MNHASLPIDDVLPQVVALLRSHPALVLQAPPGAGKTTRVPPAILEAGLLGAGQLVLLQPRRVAARACALQLARGYGQGPGGVVGYHIRFERKASEATRILVVTEGILTRRLATDPFLEGVSCVVLDEFHERSIHADLALACLRELLSVRDDLKVVVMSATLQAEPVAAFLGGCPVLTCEGRSFPLEIEHLPQLDPRPLAEKTAGAIKRMLLAPPQVGDVLVFLPGAPEIRQVQGELAQAPVEADVVPLHGSLSGEEQDRALAPAGRRKVILSTNIAQTSLTIEGVTRVIDSGLYKRARFDRELGMERLELCRISRASADQRAGRAGRLGPGHVLRLWSRLEEGALPLADEPEIRLVDLSQVLLQVLAFQPGDPRLFPFFEPPEEGATLQALELLRALGAVARGGVELTPRGRLLLGLPLPPRVGAVLLEAHRRGRGQDGALMAALLSERDVLRAQAGAGVGADRPAVSSDLLWRMELLEQVDRRGAPAELCLRWGLDPGAVRATLRVRDQLRGLLGALGRPGARSEGDEPLLKALLAGYPDRVCRRRRPGAPEAEMVGGRGVALSRESAVREAPLFLALQVEAGKRGERMNGAVLMASAVDVAWLEEVFPEQVFRREVGVFDAQRQAVIGLRQRCWGELVLEEQVGVALSAEVAGEALFQAARLALPTVFKPGEGARQLRARITLAARWLPEEEWPPLGEGSVLEDLREQCVGRRSYEELQAIDWAQVWTARLSHRQLRLLDEQLPPSLKVPSGRQIPVDYEPALEPEGLPVLAVKLQELFGLADTPRLARGKLPVVMHLLSPSMRPVQVTRDLRGFWDRTYAEVRKELRQRYPKHAWPEDPWTAPPQARPPRRPA